MKGFFQALVYVVAGTYAWIDSIGLNAKVVTVLAVFMALDMVLGWVKAVVVKDLDNPSSKKAKKGGLVKLVMFVIPAVVGLVWWAFDEKDTAMRVVNVQLMGLMIAEGYSNIGNAYTIYTGEVLSEFDAITFMFKKSGEKIRFLLEKVIGSDEKDVGNRS